MGIIGSGVCLSLLLSLLLLAAPARGELAYNVSVTNSLELAGVLRNASATSLQQPGGTTYVVVTVALSNGPGGSGDYFTLDRADWNAKGPVIIQPGEHVLIQSGAGAADPVTLDFAGMTSALLIRGGATLELDHITLRGFASKHLNNVTGYPYYRVRQMAGWPSITAEPDAQVIWRNVSSFFLSEDCSAWARNIAATNVSIYAAAGATLINSVTLRLDGNKTVSLPVVNASTFAQVGTMRMSYDDSKGYCVQDPQSTATYLPAAAATPAAAPDGPPSGGGGGHIQWWVGLIIGLAGGGTLLSAIVAAVIWYAMTWKRRKEAAAFELAVGRQGTGPASGGAAGNSAQMMKLVTDGATLTDHWKQRWLGPLEDEQVEVGPLLGRGGYGKVYKGRWKSAIVAIKIVEHSAFARNPRSGGSSPGGTGGSAAGVDSASTEARVARELLLSTSISHPNVIATYKICTIRVGEVPDAGELGGGGDGAETASPKLQGLDPKKKRRPTSANTATSSDSISGGSLLETWLLMEYADRGSLSDALRSGRFPLRDYNAIYRCLLDIASGMDYLHTSGLIHGDLKPANVLLRSTGTDARGFTCKLADFGLTRVLDTEKKTHISTQTYGTIAYMPPELLSKSRLTRSADVYSFGMLMWEICTGEVPFGNMTMGQVFFAVVQEKQRPIVPDDLPAGYTVLMQECWAESAAARPTIPQVVKRLQTLYREHRTGSISKALSSPA